MLSRPLTLERLPLPLEPGVVSGAIGWVCFTPGQGLRTVSISERPAQCHLRLSFSVLKLHGSLYLVLQCRCSRLPGRRPVCPRLLSSVCLSLHSASFGYSVTPSCSAEADTVPPHFLTGLVLGSQGRMASSIFSPSRPESQAHGGRRPLPAALSRVCLCPLAC